MRKVFLKLCILCQVCILSINVQAETSKNNEIFNTFPGKHELGMRTRYQSVNDKWIGDAEAYTTRLKLTSTFFLDANGQWQLQFEPNLVYAFNEGDYNSVTVRKKTSPIPDPQTFDLNKMYLAYQSDSDWQVKLGRQALSFDNERFVGSVEFWQKPQSFDALSFNFDNNVNWHVQYAYTNKVHRIFGHKSILQLPQDDIRFNTGQTRPLNELGVHKLNTHLLNVAYKTENNLSLLAYSYFLENKTQSHFSTQTTGFKVNDEFKPNKFKYRYAFEFSSQQDFANNLNEYKTWYNLLEASVQYKSHLLQVSQEILSADNGQVFSTSLGTNHKFQGWADVFSGYSSQVGLKDRYLTYKGRMKKLRWRGVFHHFSDYSKGSHIGNELDLELAYRATRKWEVKLVYAYYQSKNGLKDFSKANHDLSTLFFSVAYNI